MKVDETSFYIKEDESSESINILKLINYINGLTYEKVSINVWRIKNNCGKLAHSSMNSPGNLLQKASFSLI